MHQNTIGLDWRSSEGLGNQLWENDHKDQAIS